MTGPGTVSVVIATRDRPELLREAIDAVLRQDCVNDVEVVVVFDQSEPDASLGIDDGHRRVRVVTNRRSPGLAGARNTGIESAAGEYVAFCDDDDLWLPEKLSRQLALLVSEPAAGLCTCGIRVQYDGHSVDRELAMTAVRFEDLLEDRHTELHPSTFLLRRSVAREQIGLVDEEIPGGFGEDYEFLLRAARLHPVVNVPAPLVVVRWGRQSFFFRRWETMAAGLTWLLARYPEFESSARGSGRVRGQVAFAHAAMGQRAIALRWAAGALRRNPRELRALLAAAVAMHLVSADLLLRVLHRRGRSI